MKKDLPVLPIPKCNASGLALVRLGVGVFFALFGLMKFMGALGGDPMVTNMVAGIFGATGVVLTVLVWGLILTELVGGIFVIMGNLVPKLFYQLSLIGFLIIDLVSMFTVHSGDTKQLLWHGMLFLVVLGLLVSEPKCCCGITGDKK